MLGRSEEMKTYVITYNEGIVINKHIEIEAESAEEALYKFKMEKPYAIYEAIEVTNNDRSNMPELNNQ